MKNLSYLDIRTRYLEHLKKYNHSIIPSASLIPENNPTVLFVNSGMFPLVPYLMGEDHPEGTRLADVQRCLRTGDIEDVGDATHATSFEMIGNWSLNDYFKEEAIKITATFMIDELGFDVNKIYASVFEGTKDVPRDDVAEKAWKQVFAEKGIEAKVGKGERIQEYGMKKNWWELPEDGPCGPCSEVFLDTDKEACGPDCHINCDCGKFVELGNDVFMQFFKNGTEYKPLGRHNVDFGGGLERLAMISQGTRSIFEIDIYKPIYDKIKELEEHEDIKAERIITDHIRAATWIIAEGVLPGNTQREYILRRLIRRAIRQAKSLGIKDNFTRKVGAIAIDQFIPVWDQLGTKKDMILDVLEEEENKFNKTIETGLKEVEKISTDGKDPYINQDGHSFKLYETYGFPPEMLIEELANRNVKVDTEEFWKNHNAAYEKHQEMSRSSSKGMFKGGLADASQESTKLHTATHLLLKALYSVLGDHIYQKGSNITPERLRLDFPNDAKLTEAQVKEVEDLVNEQIKKELDISFEMMPKEDAMKKVPYAAFEEKYADTVKVYSIGSGQDLFSVEICGGPHVANTKELGHFKIVKQENVAAGVKRIKAILE